jgi:hypothetical protein
MISIDGKKYKVVESLGFSHDVGSYAKIILVDGVERVVVGRPGCWKFYEPQIRPRGPITGQ